MTDYKLTCGSTLGTRISVLISIVLLIATTNLSFAAESRCLASEPITIVLRNDDVSVFSDPQKERRLLNLFAAHQIPQSAGFIPQRTTTGRVDYYPDAGYQDLDDRGEIVELYKSFIKTGLIDPVQHGLAHQSNFLHAGKDLTPSELSEFSGLPLEVQREKLQTGKDILERVLEQPINVFIPPWNNLDDNTIAALQQLGFTGISDHALYAPDLSKTKIPFAQPTKPLDQLPKLLQEWQRNGKCQGSLDPEIHVFLYHSWAEYGDEGFLRMSSLLGQIQESGVKTSTLSNVFGK